MTLRGQPEPRDSGAEALRSRRPWHRAAATMVKGHSREMPTDMNARRIARPGCEEVAAAGRVSRRHEDVLAHFGYGIVEGTR